MSKKNDHSPKYLEVLVRFGLAPDVKLDDLEKSFIKFIGVDGVKSIFDLSLEYDLRPSDITTIINKLVKKGLLEFVEERVKLSEVAIRYLNSTKKDRKSEKKFRKFLNCLNEEDLDKFLELVNSFVVSDQTPSDIIKIAREIKDVKVESKPTLNQARKPTKTKKVGENKEK